MCIFLSPTGTDFCHSVIGNHCQIILFVLVRNFYLRETEDAFFVGKLSFLCDNLYLYIIVTSFKKNGASAFAVVL